MTCSSHNRFDVVQTDQQWECKQVLQDHTKSFPFLYLLDIFEDIFGYLNISLIIYLLDIF